MTTAQKLYITFERDFATIQSDLEFHFKEWEERNHEKDFHEYMYQEMKRFEYYLYNEEKGNEIISWDIIETKIDEFIQQIVD